jgi:hypothetical protein
MSPERRPEKKTLGSAGVVESLVGAGRIPVLSEPREIDLNGVFKVRVFATIPSQDGRKPQVQLLTVQNATQIRRRIERAMEATKVPVIQR